MTLFIVQFILPALLGYTLYVGVTDRLSLRRPERMAERPHWLLGLGTALSVGGVVMVALHRVYGHSLGESTALLQSAGLALALALSTTLAATGIYRRWLTRSAAKQAATPAPLYLTHEPSGPVEPTRPARTLQPGDAREELAALRLQASQLECCIDQERQGREHAEMHLRAMRKAMYMLDQEAQESKRQAADEVHLEALIENGLRTTACADARAERESLARLSSQQTLAAQCKDLLRARQDLRHSVEARARALTAATRALEHARRSARVRRRVEKELVLARATIDRRQETIDTLTQAVEKEKRRTREGVALQARQRLQHERQLEQQRSLQDAIGSVELKPHSRLVKKLARSRPLISG